jgi:hypothetical protein
MRSRSPLCLLFFRVCATPSDYAVADRRPGGSASMGDHRPIWPRFLKSRAVKKPPNAQPIVFFGAHFGPIQILLDSAFPKRRL